MLFRSSGATDTGGIFDPAANGWTATSTTGAPSAREAHTAVWTGSKMIVWGGIDSSSNPNTGGVYDPATDTWTPTSTVGAPDGRYSHTAVWTGSKMNVWGGGSGDWANTGGIYDPATDTWTATSTTNAPTARGYHRAVWTGSKMIVWGGTDSWYMMNTGGVYSNPLPPTDFYTVTPCRVVDTRNADGPTGGPILGGKTTRSFPVTGGVCGVPSTALAVSVNLTAVGAAAAGYLTLFPGDAAGPPLVSNLNFSVAQTRANTAIAVLATDGTGTVQVKNGSVGAVHFVLDVNGYFQ